MTAHIRVRHGDAKRWTAKEYLRLTKLGFFDDTRVELIGGEISEMSPQLNPHVLAVELTVEALRAAFGDEFWVRSEATLNLSPLSMPDPDVSVLAGNRRTHGREYPTTALLVVEVSDATLDRDRKRKGSLYAAAGITDYWIVNLIDQQLEIYRDPQPDQTTRFRHSYSQKRTLKPGEQVSPLALSQAVIKVEDLFP